MDTPNCCSGKENEHIKSPSQLSSIPITKITHPLDPLSGYEINLAVTLIKERKKSVDFINVVLHEPHKNYVLQWKEGDPIERSAFVQVHDRKEEKSYEVIVDLNNSKIESFKHITNIQPPFVPHEYKAIQKMLVENDEFKKALLKRGITDPHKISCELWSVGWFSKEDDPNRRLAWVLCYYKNDENCEEYNYPIEGLCPLVDLNKFELIRIDDFRIAKLPKNDSGYFGEQYKVLKTPKTQLPLKSLKVVQPEGPSFTLDGYKLRWHFWEMRIGFTPREGLVLHQVGIYDNDQFRPIIYRASISEMVVPYGSPHPPHFRKNAFDVSEDGMGANLNRLNAGCDCIGSPQFLDVTMADEFGNIKTIKNAICIHEEDGGILWKHTNWRTGKCSLRRARRLVLSTFTTVSNYDYGFRWYFDLDGSIEFEMLLTGIISVRILRGGDKDYGTNVDNNPYISGTYHQHFVSMRLHMMVDGEKNSVVEVNSVGLPPSEMNPYGNAFMATKTLLRREAEAQRIINPLTGRTWSIVNPNKNNKMGYPVSYKLEPGENVLPMAQPDSFIIRRCPFISKHLWVTQYHPDEKFPAGNYPSQQPSELDGIVEWTKKNRKVDNEDIVVWYNFGAHHLPRPEDWPIMPQTKVGFKLRPNGFFDKNPTLNLPPPLCEVQQSKL